MMLRDLPGDASFWLFLFSIDQDLAETARKNACSCGGRLHCANYPRKPRGVERLPDQYGYRLSFCCDREGCRRRVTPPSVRFLGPKVYLGAVVILVAAMRQGPSPRRVAELSRLFGANRRPSFDGRSSGESSFRRRRSGKSRAVVSYRRSTWPFFHDRSWKHSSAATMTTKAGENSSCFCRRSRSPEA